MGFFSRTKTTVSASASVNPLVPLGAKKSGVLQYAITTASAGIGYSQYRTLDQKQGSTGEIHKAYNVGALTGSTVKLVALDGNEVTNPVDDYNDTKTSRVYSGSFEELDFMPLLMIKSDTHPDGVIKANDASKDKVIAKRVAKAMNIKLEDLTESLVETKAIPQVGTPEWAKYAKAHRDSGETSTEGAYRSKLVRDSKKRKKAAKDITDISVGYYGTFNPKATVMPEALYYTMLSCLAKTKILDPSDPGKPAIPPMGTPGNPGYKPGEPALAPLKLGIARRFGIHGKLYNSIYSLNGYIHREVNGVIPGNDYKHLGYAKVSVHLNDEEPLAIHKGKNIHTDYNGSKKPFFAKHNWNNGFAVSEQIPDSYVSIKVQITPTMYRELVLVDFYQETSIDGNGKSRLSNSGNQSRNEKEMTWKEAYIAESFIPLTRSSMVKVKMLRRANLLIESKSQFIQVMNVTKTKLKWWQTGVFKILVVVVTIVISVMSGGTLAGALIKMAIGLAVSYAMNILIKVLVKLGLLDEAWAIALLAVAAVVGITTGTVLDLTDISVILQVVEATGKVYVEQTIQATKEYQEKADKLREEKEKLEASSDDLENMHTSSNIGQLLADLHSMLDAVTGPLIETRDEFLNRTLSTEAVTQELTGTALVADLYRDKG